MFFWIRNGLLKLFNRQLRIINKETIINNLFVLSLMKLIGLLFLLNNKEINSENEAITGADGRNKTPKYSNFKPTLLKFIPF